MEKKPTRKAMDLFSTLLKNGPTRLAGLNLKRAKELIDAGYAMIDTEAPKVKGTRVVHAV